MSKPKVILYLRISPELAERIAAAAAAANRKIGAEATHCLELCYHAGAATAGKAVRGPQLPLPVARKPPRARRRAP